MFKRGARGVAVLVAAAGLLGAGCVTPSSPYEVGNGCTSGVSDPEGPTEVGVSYGPDEEHLANVYPACTETAVGTIMYTHGGGYTGGFRTEGNHPKIKRLRDQGWVVVSIDYRLAPFHGYPSQVNDARRAISWWRGGAANTYGAPVYPLVGSGWSAGGQIAEWTTVQDTGVKYDATFTSSGATDWPSRPPSAAAQALFGIAPQEWQLVEASTTTHLDPGDPPFLHFHGIGDSYVPDSQATTLDAVIQTDGDPAKHKVYLSPASCGHSLDCMDDAIVDAFLASLVTP